jgi:tetratricopeptide (TPR) repeat protein
MKMRTAAPRLLCWTATLVYSVTTLVIQARAQSAPSVPEQSTVSSDAENCFLPPLNSLEMLATGAGFQVPAKSQHEFAEACASLRGKKVVDAEVHLRRALRQDAKFPAAWVLLGQVLEAEQRMDEAHNACTKPASYLPAYLCLADISARAKNWDEVLRLSSLALEIDPATVAPAYTYNAAANFNLHNLPAAEKSALRAIDIDTANKDPRVHFLLAQIYEAEGDHMSQAAQLREYLKCVTDPNDAEMVKKVLASLGG